MQTNNKIEKLIFSIFENRLKALDLELFLMV